MLSSTTLSVPAALFVAGCLLHILVFRRGEWHLEVSRLCLLYGMAHLLLVCYLEFIDGYMITEAVWAAVQYGSCHFTGIFTSMVVYALFFHPLRHFPGPLWARISNIYLALLSARELHLFLEIQKLHEKYGDFVRTGRSPLGSS